MQPTDKTLEIVVGMPARLREVSQGRPSLMVMASVLLDLLIRTEGMDLTDSELSDHISAETEHYLNVDWYVDSIQEDLRALYESLQIQVWPLLKDRLDIAASSVVSLVTPHTLQLSLRQRRL